MTDALLLVSHGTVDALDDLPAFLANIRRGHAPPPELVAEVRRRYEVIGGKSPLNAINESLAKKLEARLSMPVRLANRLWNPYPARRIEELVAIGVTRVLAVPLAQHSGHVYAESVREAARAAHVEARCAENWGQTPELTGAYAARVTRALDALPRDRKTTVLMTAHSLPRAVIDAGDPYEREVRASAEAIAERAGVRYEIAFQSQGMSGGAWLGPDLPAALDAARARGDAHVLVAPIGFLADHVEILYDLDVEAKELAKARGLSLSRTESLNDADDLVDAIAKVAEGLAR